MAPPLVPCPSCQRHVRIVEEACPFCTAALPDDLAARVAPGTTRAAAFTFSASIAVLACTGGGGTLPESESVDGGTGSDGGFQDSGRDAGTNAAAYGAPEPEDAGTGPQDDGSIGAKYGLPPMDGG